MIKYLIMDVDGSLTDGKVYMGVHGENFKAFSIKDGYAINYILKPNQITPMILTARNSPIVLNRCNELGITEVYQGKLDKIALLKEVVGEENFGQCAYFGDDILDLKCMEPIKEAGGIIGCPSDAVHEIRAIADYVCRNKAGEGALREFSEWLISPYRDIITTDDEVDSALEYLKSLDVYRVERNKKIIVNDDFYYTVQTYETKPLEYCKFESHRKYIDIQIMVEGEELMQISDISRLTVQEEYDKEKDIIFWTPPTQIMSFTFKKGNYVVLYPENAHRGAIKYDKQTQVLKIVGKVRCIKELGVKSANYRRYE